jgi:hypothetical protein
VSRPIGEDATQGGDDGGATLGGGYQPTWDEMTRDQRAQRVHELEDEILRILAAECGFQAFVEKPRPDDRINPAHYKTGGIEVIDILRQKLTPEEFRGFCKGNIIKYSLRAERKGGREDYEKAAWYGSWLAGRDPRR